jgi:hypothetical protein
VTRFLPNVSGILGGKMEMSRLKKLWEPYDITVQYRHHGRRNVAGPERRWFDLH